MNDETDILLTSCAAIPATRSASRAGAGRWGG